MRYMTLLIDPPWPQSTIGGGWYPKDHKHRHLPYSTMSLADIASLPVPDLLQTAAHVYLWTTNRHLHDAYHMMDTWDLRVLAPITWVKPSGMGAWWVHRTQHLLMAYHKSCKFPLGRLKPNVIFANTAKHSRKPPESYDLIESVSPEPRLELFARPPIRPGWHVWGNEIPEDLQANIPQPLSSNGLIGDLRDASDDTTHNPSVSPSWRVVGKRKGRGVVLLEEVVSNSRVRTCNAHNTPPNAPPYRHTTRHTAHHTTPRITGQQQEGETGRERGGEGGGVVKGGC